MSFWKGTTCSNTIATGALNIFAGQKDALQEAHDKIAENKTNREKLLGDIRIQEQELITQILVDESEMARLLQAKEKLDEILN